MPITPEKVVGLLEVLIPEAIALYRTTRGAGNKTIEELLADADSRYDAIIARADKELNR